MDFLDKLVPAVLNGGTGAIIALALIWYLRHRDGRDAAEKAGPANLAGDLHRTSKVDDAIIEIAAQCGRQTEILRAQTEILKECRDGHQETARQLARVETKLDVMRVN
jgi:undecaprenyl pyrophosphate synthase